MDKSKLLKVDQSEQIEDRKKEEEAKLKEGNEEKKEEEAKKQTEERREKEEELYEKEREVEEMKKEEEEKKAELKKEIEEEEEEEELHQRKREIEEVDKEEKDKKAESIKERKEAENKQTEEGKEEEGAKKAEEKARAVLISEDKSLDKVISKHHQISRQIQERDQLNGNDLLKTCSGGRALQGILLTKVLQDQLDDRLHLLKVPEKISVADTSESEDNVIEFFSTDQEDQYKKMVDVLGHSIAVSTSIPVYGSVTINADTSTNDRTEDEKRHTKEMYTSTVRYFTMHVASYSFEKKDLLLSEDALSDLKELSKMLKIESANNVQQLCENFFHNYGSHVNLGPLSFGGNIWWKFPSRGTSQKQLHSVMTDTISRSAGEVAGRVLNTDSELNLAEIKGSYTAEFSLASTILQVKINGGPPEATDLSQWKSGLVANNSTWILTSRGKKLIAVWDIIRMNYEEKLGDVREVLRRAWEGMTGLKAEQDTQAILSYDSDIVLKEVSEWKVQHMTPHQIQDNLKHLVEIKKDILNKTANPTLWISEYLSCSSLQDFIHSLMKSKLTSPILEDVKLLLRQLVEPDELLSQMDTPASHFVEISIWLYELCLKVNCNFSDFENFNIILKDLLERVRGANLLFGSVVPTQKLAMSVSKVIHHLRSLYRLGYDDILVTIIVYPYQDVDGSDESGVTLKPLSVKDLESLHKEFSEQRARFDEYKQKQPLQCQAYLFHLAVDYYHPNVIKENQFKLLLQRISNRMRNLEPSLEEELSMVLNEYIGGSSLSRFKESLNSLMTSSIVRSRSPSTKNDLHSLLKTMTQKNEAIATDNSSVFRNNPKAHDLFEKLGLCKHYPKGLQIQDALCIRQESLKLSLSETHPTDPKQLPFLILHKLMSYDSQCRSDLMPADNMEGGHQSEHNKDNDSDDDSVDSDESDGDESEVNSNGIHPVDILLALILCSDDFLRQDLFSRLAKCQLALPFLLPDPFTKQLTLPLWAMRSIIKEWKCFDKDGSEVQRTHPIVSYEMPIVSFIRFGKPQQRHASKSKILNEVISDSHYDHFFNHDCPGGEKNHLLTEGLVDMCWYLPAGKPSDAFPDAVSFLNLHGDGRHHIQQIKFLSQISTMCFVLLTEKNLNFDEKIIEILKQSLSVITILNDTNKKKVSLKKEIPNAHVIKLSTRTASHMDSIRQSIKESIKNLEDFKSIEDSVICYDIREEGILIDESSDSCKKGLSLAKGLMSIVTSCKEQEDAMLPLQGDKMWRAWAANDKELYRHTQRGNKRVNNYTADIQSVKKNFRNNQLKHINSLTPLTESFIVSLLELGGTSNRNYFLKHLKLELDNLSRKSISEMQHQCQSIHTKLSKLQAKSDSYEGEVKIKSDKLKKELEDLQESIINSSFGLEHLFRELGQVYEAALESGDYGKNLSRLPELAAVLFIDGYPLELMDGAAAHVPLEWVTAVLHSAIEKLGDPNIFVLSVLGIQSTGKSTMLNTVFGLQFNVSAGRCTRGAFMQLLPLDEEFQQRTKCEYVLVVDTEGLRAPQLNPLQTQKHDNELATFVIGLANMTLINIYGEVTGDMDDILQTSVHAFLRMTQVKFNPSCHFVHHNAGANINSEVGRTRFLQKLNQNTIDAAREENCEGQFMSFNDIIKFDIKTDVHHFKGLWKGDPPMAPINMGYSQSAQMLKKHFIESVCRFGNSSEGYLHLSSFAAKINDLWQALLKENFVFSFKNTLEITAYNSLETAYSKWAWEFTEAMLRWEQNAENAISSAPLEEVSALVKEKCVELHSYVLKKIEPLKLKMKEHFNGKQSEILVQWKAKFEKRLEHHSLELKSHAEQHCTKLGKSRQVICKLKYAEMITEKIHEHIANIKEEQENLDHSLQERKLKPEQLKKVLERRVFTSENTELYREQKIITKEEAEKINTIIQQCGGQLTEDHLNHIMVGGVLATDQVRMILKKRRQTEEELEKSFNAIWTELIHQLPTELVERRDVAAEVESKLVEFVHHESQIIIEALQKKSLRDWGTPFEPEKTIHYSHVHKDTSWKISKAFNEFYYQTLVSDLAITATHENIKQAKQYLKDITKENNDFNPALVRGLLHVVDTIFSDTPDDVKDYLTFTPRYKYRMYLTICGYAIPEFERMAESFRERNDPLFYLENNLKNPLFTKFKNQYNQTEAEEAIANTLCSYLDQSIKVQVRKNLCAKMFGFMKSSEHHFSSKMAMKVKILTDLLKEDEFMKYMSHIYNAENHLQNRIYAYVLKFCDEKVSGENTRLQLTAKEEVSRLVQLVKGKVAYMNESNINKWLSAFCGDTNIRDELGVVLKVDELLKGYKALHELNLQNFKHEIHAGLNELEKKLQASFDFIECESEMVHWKDLPLELSRNLIGCTEQCPFCKEQCDHQDPHHVENGGQNHRVQIHRPNCLAGFRWTETEVLTTDFCPALVSDNEVFSNADTKKKQHSYKDYQEIYPDWSIPPDPTSAGSLYWMWFVGKYKEELSHELGAEAPEVPAQWLEIKKEEVERKLKSMYNL